MLSSMSKKLVIRPKKIIALGEPAIPLILRELRDRPGFWFEALKSSPGSPRFHPTKGPIHGGSGNGG